MKIDYKNNCFCLVRHKSMSSLNSDSIVEDSNQNFKNYFDDVPNESSIFNKFINFIQRINAFNFRRKWYLW